MHGAVIEGGLEGRINVGYVWMISLTAALGGLLFGYDWVVIGGAKPFFEAYFQLTSEAMQGWAVSCALLGCLVGTLMAGRLADRFGRRPMLILAAVIFGVSSVLTGWAYSFNAFVLWRILGGVAIGMASNVSPIYIAEISPSAWRGRLVSLNQMTIVLGILAAQIVNLLIARKVEGTPSMAEIAASWNGQYAWRWMFTAVTIPSLVFFLAALVVPESPRWLMGAGDEKRARKTLERIGGEDYAQRGIATMRQATQQTGSAGESAASWGELFKPGLLRPLILGVALAILQQWCGINVIFNYADEIFKSAGYGVNDVLFNIVITGTINFLATLVALGCVDKFGRRKLMLLGCGGIAISHLLLAGCGYAGIKGTAVLILTLSAIGMYALSLAPITWVLISEIFPNRIRGQAVSLAVSALWVACFVLTYTFPLLNKALGSGGTFGLYGLICLGGFVLILKAVPETKGRSLEEISASFEKN